MTTSDNDGFIEYFKIIILDINYLEKEFNKRDLIKYTIDKNQ